MHVLSPRTADPFHPDHQFPTPQEYEQRLHALAESELALFVPRDDRPLRIRQLLRSAPEVERGILEVAAAEQVDLMVLGTHGRRGVSHLLIGSTASELLRRSDVPVLVVPSRSQRPVGRLRRILAPTDFSPSASDAVASARELAAESGATLELFHVLPNLEVPLPMNPGSFGAGIVADLEPSARAALEELAAKPGPAARVEIAVWQGPAATSIVNRATETDVDLVVLASHGRSGLDRLLLGSVTEKVARLSTCPVLVLPAHATPESPPA